MHRLLLQLQRAGFEVRKGALPVVVDHDRRRFCRARLSAAHTDVWLALLNDYGTLKIQARSLRVVTDTHSLMRRADIVAAIGGALRDDATDLEISRGRMQMRLAAIATAAKLEDAFTRLDALRSTL